MILHTLFVLVFWALFFALVGLVVVGAFAMYCTFMSWITGEEWLP